MNTTSNRVRLSVYDLPEGKIALPDRSGAVFFVYVRSGGAHVLEREKGRALGTDEGCFVTTRVSVEPGAQVWLFEKTDLAAHRPDAEIVASYPAELAVPGEHIVRADRIESENGAQTPRHGHRGPGLRRLICGRLRAEVGENVARIEAGQAWFESGREPVVGTNYGGGPAAFVRLLVLPYELAGGKSSFVPANNKEAAKPRSVRQRLFGEVTVI